MCGIPIQLNGDVLAAYLSKYGEVDDVTLARSPARTAHGDYVINMGLNREGFQVIPHIIKFQDRNMMVIVESKRPLCWSCKQLGHFSRSCPQTSKMSTAMSATATTATATATITTGPGKKPEHGDDPNKEVGWSQVVRKGKNLNPHKIKYQQKQQSQIEQINQLQQEKQQQKINKQYHHQTKIKRKKKGKNTIKSNNSNRKWKPQQI